MPGMGKNLSSTNTLIVDAFHHALWLQFLIVLAIGALLALMRSALRARQFRAAAGTGAESVVHAPTATSEATGRRLLRVGFGLLWVLDGILQGQSAMPLSLPSQVLQPAAAGSPSWVVHLVTFGANLWSDHPVTAAAAAVWIQVGVGLLLLVAPRGRWSRFAGAVSVGWGLLVWVFGEALGGILAPGASWLFGAPGAALLYVVAGAVLMLPDRAWTTPSVGRWLLRGTGLFFVGMAVLQAWPGRGFWQGQTRSPSSTPGQLEAMVHTMSQTSQPSPIASLLSAFGRFDAAHGWAVNLFVVVALAVIGTALWSSRPRVLRLAVGAALALCLATWVLVQDLGFFGGVGTDPNSMVPLGLLLVGGYLGVSRVAVPVAAPQPVAARDRVGAFGALEPSYLFRAAAAIGALVVVLIGAVPMAASAASSNADPVLQEALNGVPEQVDVPAPNFDLVDQSGHAVTLSSFRGRTVVVTFLDPVCTSDCPVIAQELRAADKMLGAQSARVAMVAIVSNPIYNSIQFTRAFDRQEYLSTVPNWYFLTGTDGQLTTALNRLGASAIVEPAGAMVDHSEFAMVIDGTGHIRTVLSTDPGPATPVLQSSFASLLDTEIHEAMAPTSAG